MMNHSLLVPFLAFAAAAQQAAPPAFDVASVKVSDPNPPQPAAVLTGGGSVRSVGVARGCRRPNPGTFTCTNATLKMVLMQAYDVKAYQIEGPAWIDSDRYDVMAKVPEGVSPDLVPAMLQQLLAERFKVVAHKETKPLAAYELTVAKGGPRMKEVDAAEVAAFNAAQEARRLGNPPATPPPAPGGRRSVSDMPLGSIGMSFSSNGARTQRGKINMTQLTNMLTNEVSRPVIDKTDLKGTYEIELSYLADQSSASAGALRALGPPPGASAGSDPARLQADAEAPIATIFQAVQQTLGLKLEAKKLPIDVVVVDSANKVPTEN